jgi:hypothetical protein
MLWRVRNSRGRALNAPAAFIHPCQPIVAKQPPIGPGWAHELKHDGYRLRWSGSLDDPALAVFVCRLYSALAEMKPGGCRMAKKRKAKKTKRRPKAKRRKRSTRILGVPIPSIS